MVLSDTHADNGNVEYKARNNADKIEVKFIDALTFIQSKLN
jgi:prolyl-tRNA synthetase